MKIERLRIKNFRGIKSLDWVVNGKMICLIGANNSTKSTVLNAIDRALSSKWNTAFTDTDFYASDTTDSIKIDVFISELPDSLVSDQKYGAFLMGWSKDGRLSDEPENDSEIVICVRLEVPSTLEPTWSVVCHRGEKAISANDRQELGLAFVAAYVDRDFSWGKGTPLSRVTSNTDTLDFSEINRKSREAIAALDLDQLTMASSNVEQMVKSYGVKPQSKFQPAVDPDKISINTGTFALHDGNVPVRQYGLGSKKLVSVALQSSMTRHGAIILIDEIEHGLEPYRIRQLIRQMRPVTITRDQPAQVSHPSQVITTSHSPTAIVELDAHELYVVRSIDGNTTITRVPSDFQDLVRSVPEALLSPRVIVCEGKTEVGILRALDKFWADQTDKEGFAYSGVYAVAGGGSEAPAKALKLKQLGYDVALLIDSDCAPNPSIKDLEDAGVAVFIWDGKFNTEQRIFSDLPTDDVLGIVKLTISMGDETAILDKLSSELKENAVTLPRLEALLKDNSTELATRSAIARASLRKHPWFKRTDLGEKLGTIVAEALEQIPHSDLAIKLHQLENWIYANG